MRETLLGHRLRINPEVLHPMEQFVHSTHLPLRLFDQKGVLCWHSGYFEKRWNFCKLIQSNGGLNPPCGKVHQKALRESLRWGEVILSKCCYFVMQMVSPVLDKGRVIGHLVASPFLLIQPSELQPEELLALIKTKRNRSLEKALHAIPVLKDDDVQEAVQHLFKLADQLSNPDLGDLLKVREAQILQGKIADQIRDLKDFDREFTPDSLSKLFHDREKEIVTKIRLGDRSGAKEILYQLLAIILVQYLENFELLKVSILELLIILSRAAVEAGAKVEEMLGLRYRFVTELSRIRNQEDLCLWIVKVLEKMTDQIYQTRNAKNYQRLKRALDFIEQHCGESLTIEQVAREAYLSASRLSHIIKDELGMTLIDYLSKTRVQKAKERLNQREVPIAQIAQEVGFSDQSYFTKVFKKVEGCTPKDYRKNLFQTHIGREPTFAI